MVAVRDILWQSPGKRRVELRFTGEGRKWAGRQVKMMAGDEFRVAWTAELESRLGPWLKRGL